MARRDAGFQHEKTERTEEFLRSRFPSAFAARHSAASARRRLFAPVQSFFLQPAAGMLRPRRLDRTQNPSPQDPTEF